MSTADTPDSVVLLGGGHTHLHVLKHWRARMRPGVSLICISDYPVATYSGMLTGVLAGDYPASAMEVPLAPLCDATGARLIVGRVLAVDLAGKRLHLADGGNLPFAVLSVGVGSRPDTRGVAIGEAPGFVLIKPMQTFLLRLREALTAPQGLASPLRVAIVGGGAAGVEIALCLRDTGRRPPS